MAMANMIMRRFKPVFRLATLALCGLCSALAQADTLSGWVVKIVDGDTIAVRDTSNRQHMVRLVGAGAPDHLQAFGDQSQQNLGSLVYGRDVTVEWERHDPYGRIVGKVMVALPNCIASACPKVLDAGLAQVAAGFAWWFRPYAGQQPAEDRRTYEQAEFQAKIRRLGLWSGKNPAPPWERRY